MISGKLKNKMVGRSIIAVLCFSLGYVIFVMLDYPKYFTSDRTNIHLQDSSDSPESIVTSYWSKINQGKLRDSRTYITSCNTSTCFDEAPMNLTEALIEKEDWKLDKTHGETNNNKEEAEVYGTVKDKNGRIIYIKHYLIKTANNWKIFSIDYERK